MPTKMTEPLHCNLNSCLYSFSPWLIFGVQLLPPELSTSFSILRVPLPRFLFFTECSSLGFATNPLVSCKRSGKEMENDHVSWHKHLVCWLAKRGWWRCLSPWQRRVWLAAARREYTGTEIDFSLLWSCTIPPQKKGGKARGMQEEGWIQLWEKMSTAMRKQGH